MPDPAAAPRGGEATFKEYLDRAAAGNDWQSDRWKEVLDACKDEYGCPEDHVADAVGLLLAERDRLAGEVERLQVSGEDVRLLMGSADHIRLDHPNRALFQKRLRALATRLGGGSRE